MGIQLGTRALVGVLAATLLAGGSALAATEPATSRATATTGAQGGEQRSGEHDGEWCDGNERRDRNRSDRRDRSRHCRDGEDGASTKSTERGDDEDRDGTAKSTTRRERADACGDATVGVIVNGDCAARTPHVRVSVDTRRLQRDVHRTLAQIEHTVDQTADTAQREVARHAAWAGRTVEAARAMAEQLVDSTVTVEHDDDRTQVRVDGRVTAVTVTASDGNVTVEIDDPRD